MRLWTQYRASLMTKIAISDVRTCYSIFEPMIMMLFGVIFF